MSILSLPAEVLLQIFNDPNLEGRDLKSLRLSHPFFRPIAADRLFRRLYLPFIPKPPGGQPQPLHTLTQRIQSLLDDSNASTSSSDIESFRAANYRELSILFSATHRNGFVTFTRSTCKKLLPLFSKLSLLKVELPRAATLQEYWDPYRVDRAMEDGQRKFFLALENAFDNGLAVEALDYRGTESWLPQLAAGGGSCLKKLKVDVEPEGRPYNIPWYVTESIARCVVNSPHLESLVVKYYPDLERYYPRTTAVLFERVLDRVPTPVLKIKELEIGSGISMPERGVNVAKLGNVEELKCAVVSRTDRNDKVWREAVRCGMKLRAIRGAAALCEGLLEYLASEVGSGVEVLEVANVDENPETAIPPIIIHHLWVAPSAPLPAAPSTTPRPTNAALRRKFLDNVLPTISQRLTSLTISTDVMILSKRPEISFQLLQNTPFDTASTTLSSNTRLKGVPGAAFSELMELIKGFEKLKVLKVKVRPRGVNAKSLGEESRWRYVGIAEGWEGRGDGWKDVASGGLVMKVKMEKWDINRRGLEWKIRGVYGLEKVEEEEGEGEVGWRWGERGRWDMIEGREER